MPPSMFTDAIDLEGTEKAAAFIARILERHDLGSRWSYHAWHNGDRYYGLGRSDVTRVFGQASAVINLHGGTRPRPEHFRGVLSSISRPTRSRRNSNCIRTAPRRENFSICIPRISLSGKTSGHLIARCRCPRVTNFIRHVSRWFLIFGVSLNRRRDRFSRRSPTGDNRSGK